ncbi:MAG TPA: GNAT family N-acetyltransferase [Casimicrobiaceae bacterium]|nr:GNAT family N-acetyltransferase [Casimicrobiaceae bacterium]
MAAVDVALTPARRAHAPMLARLSRDLIEVGLGWEYRADRMAKLISDRNATTLVAHDGPRCVGFGVMTFGDDRAHLVLLAVVPTHRRRGIARAMMNWLLESAKTAGIASIHLELLEDNAAARAFYRALGFTETLRLPGYYRASKTAMRMILVLRRCEAPRVCWTPPPRTRC